MFIDVNQYVHVLCTMNITANQFLLCYLLYTDQKVDNKYVRKGVAIANLYKYASFNKRSLAWTKEEVRDLVDKGYLVDPHYRKDDTLPDLLVVTDKFIELVFAKTDRFEEFWEAYPKLIDNFRSANGPKIKLKVCDKDKMKEIYLTKVKSKTLHNKIMEVVRWGKASEKLNVSLENFIRSHQWEVLMDEMEEDFTNIRAAQ